MIRPRSILSSSLLAALLAFGFACGESGSSAPTPIAPKAVLAPPETSPPPAPEKSVGECTADIDCATTVLPSAPVTSESDCCFPTCEKHVAPRKQVDELQAAFGATCKAVLCAPQSCPNRAEPVPVCREHSCVARP